LLAVIRNCGVAIAISIFFAAAREPSHRPSAAEPSAVRTKYPESTAPAKETSTCDQPAGRVCRLVDAGLRMSEWTP
jgi:hypothetical protein